MSDSLKSKTLGLVIVIITFSVCTVFLASVLIPLWQQIPMSDTRASTVEDVIHALIGIILLYAGSEIRGKSS